MLMVYCWKTQTLHHLPVEMDLLLLEVMFVLVKKIHGQGKLMSFIVWDVALTAEQVQQIYTETPPPPVASILVEPTSIQESLIAGESSTKVFSITNTGDLPLNWSTSPLDTEEEMTFERPDVESIVASINSRGSGTRNNSQILTAANGSRVVERPDDVDIATVYHSQRNGNPLDGALLYSDGESEMLSTKDALLATGLFNTLSVINVIIIRQHLKNFQLLRPYLFGQIMDLNKLKRLEMYWQIMWTMVVG